MSTKVPAKGFTSFVYDEYIYEPLDYSAGKAEEYKRIGNDIQKEHMETLLQLTELHRIAYLDGKPCTIEYSKDTFIDEERLAKMLSALETVSETWESNNLFKGTITTKINLAARQIFDTSLITNEAEMAKLYEIILRPFRDHLEATLDPLVKVNDHKFNVRLYNYSKGGKQPLHSSFDT